ncbi:hypothetical protein E0500_027905 [Streptomyces sp. KM273126]|uniref:hypothetical protein n=1 Tax=Streptomyces sp. KM273126 TaxID=2545247 RepID=UPI0014043197|nr:hypothetical protein [Streptomyces sp. KM273126]MBA2811122.1 hypothetical protein [Streptomyces sp. KM273126]
MTGRETATAAPPPPLLPCVLADIAPLLDHRGYLAVAALVFAEDFGSPSPAKPS